MATPVGKPAEESRSENGAGILQRLLQLLGNGGLHTVDEAARQLGVSEGLASAMVDALARKGYLQAFQGSCETYCGSCPVSSVCSVPGEQKARLLALTPKGRQAAAAA